VSNERIAYVVNHVAFFVSRRLPLAIGAMHSGFEARLVTGQAGVTKWRTSLKSSCRRL
jgi:hypothetical protein